MTGAAPTIEGTSFDGPAFSREEIGAYKICDASISDRGVARREVSDPESEMMQLPVDDPPGARTRWETFSGKLRLAGSSTATLQFRNDSRSAVAPMERAAFAVEWTRQGAPSAGLRCALPCCAGAMGWLQPRSGSP